MPFATFGGTITLVPPCGETRTETLNKNEFLFCGKQPAGFYR